MAALFTSTSTPPWAPARPRTTWPVRSRSAKSQGTKKALPAGPEVLISCATSPPRLPGRSMIATFPPSRAKPAAIADPSPPAAPVTITVLPAKRIRVPLPSMHPSRCPPPCPGRCPQGRASGKIPSGDLAGEDSADAARPVSFSTCPSRHPAFPRKRRMLARTRPWSALVGEFRLDGVRRGSRGGFGFEFRFRPEQFLPGGLIRDGIARVDLDQCLRDHRRRADSREPLVVGRDDMPGRPLGARMRQHVGEGVLVVIPVPALPDIAGREFPVLLRQVDPLEEADPLFFL